MLAGVLKDFSLNLTYGSAETFTLGGNMSSIPWHEVFLEIRCSCNLSHLFYL